MPPKPNPKPKLTHFLLLPLVTPTSRPQLQSSIQRFATEVTAPNDAGEATLPAKAIRPVGSIHFTIGVMSLLTQERVDDACGFLKGVDVGGMLRAAAAADALPDKSANDKRPDSAGSGPPSPPLLSAAIPLEPTESTQHPPTESDPPPHQPQPQPQPPPLTLTLSGLHSLRPPSRTSSLHATPHATLSSPTLHPFATLLRTAFTSAGFLLPETRPLNLHATIVNTIYARRAHGSGKLRWGKGSGKFDARALVERFEGVVWAGDVRVEKVAICEMGAVDVDVVGGEGEEGQGEGVVVVDKVYKEVASVELP